ncbi:ABC transporter ATP-binding protein [Paraburkholderia sp. ZP32-5]|uniref:ABC transporter ATP-binding protein n=1 Tax=Paraburkholderia sp. ZP32-5 TaxID=2883245 RepID=UPI001F399B9D|nr:ABC transporter ATP-binding protein [Paraburkholderia sp. ZP32-5]
MLNIQNLNTVYLDSHGAKVAGIENVSFEVPEGKLFTLLGPSGCGKSTTLRSIAGLEKPDGGRITANGVTVFDAARKTFVPPNKRQFGMVFQSYAIWPHMTVFKNCSFPLEVGTKKFSKQQIADKVMRALTAVGLDHAADRDATKMSGGQQQRLALARAIVMEPKLLLLDEPLSNLDAKLRDKMRFELKRLQRELNVTTIYVTHDQEEALAMSHEIAIMKDGHIVQKARPRDIYEQPANQFVADFIGTTSFVDGTVRDTNGQTLTVNSSIGPITVAHSEGMNVGAKAVVSLRPENLEIFASKPTTEHGNVFEGTVYSKVFLGETLDLQIKVGEQILLARAHPSHREPVGAKIWVTVDPARCIALNPQ